MSDEEKNKLGQILWDIANNLRGTMDADDFRDYMLSFLFLRYLSSNYEKAVKKELGSDYPQIEEESHTIPLQLWYNENPDDIKMFEKMMRKKVHYVIPPEFTWDSIAEMARIHDKELLKTLYDGFKHIEEESFESSFGGLFSEINLNSEKLGKTHDERNKKLCEIISKIASGIKDFSTDSDKLGDAYEYLIGQFAAGSGKKAGEFYTPQAISTILSQIVTLDSQDPRTGKKRRLDKVFDFACGSGSLLLNVKKHLGKEGTIGKIYGQEKNITTYNLARMNMLLHGVKDNEFEIFHGDSLTNDWDILQERNPNRQMKFDAIVANPPFSYRWDPSEEMAKDIRFATFGVAPKSAADFAFLLHGFNYLDDAGTMAIILPHGVLFRGGAEERIRRGLLEKGYIDTVIGLPSNLFFSTGIPVCILVLKRCKKSDDVLFINASEHFAKGKRQNRLRMGENGEPNDIEKIVNTYKYRTEKDRYSKRITIERIEEEGYNLNISRYISTAKAEKKIDLKKENEKLVDIEKDIVKYTKEHNRFLEELGLDLLP